MAALDCRGIRAALLVPRATDRDLFLSFLEHVLGPQLRPGAVVVMDNVSAHKNTDVAEALRRRGAQLCYLPPYSPDYNPIEMAWSKIKTLSNSPSRRSPHRMPKLGFDIVATPYTNLEFALEAVRDLRDTGNSGVHVGRIVS